MIDRPVDRAIYELHIRDFSATDESVPEELRGTYLAFTQESAGTDQLEQLSDAGINTVHLLPSFDIASIEEDRAAQLTPACDLPSLPADSAEQQACVNAVADQDAFNWGYDPYHYSAPEGSYATDPDGGARVSEFRSMVGALHGMGLQVVLDEVYNHTAQSGQGEKSVLDQVVPGYYHRLNASRRGRDLDVLPERRHRARGRREAHGRLDRAVGARIQGRRLPLRPHGPPLEGRTCSPCATRSTS